MANTYTVSPNIIPGNVSIGGNLTVNGDELRVGVATPYVRLCRLDANTGAFTVNLPRNLGPGDDPTRYGHGYVYDVQLNQIKPLMRNIPQVGKWGANRLVVIADTTIHSGVGSGGNLSLVGRTLIGQLIPSTGMLLVNLWGTFTTGAGGAVNFAANFGGVSFPVVSSPANTSGTFQVSFLLCNVNATNVNRLLAFGAGPAMTNPGAAISSTIDTTVNQVLNVFCSFALGTDSVSVFGIEGVLLNTSPAP